MRVLILGGAGFVGRHFARRLINDGNQVLIVDNMSSGQRPHTWAFKPDREPGTFLRQIDVRNFCEWAKPDDFDLILHCAAVVGGRLKIEGDPLAVATDLAIDADFFNWAVKGKQPKKVVYFSSSAVYPIELQGRSYCALGESLVSFDGNRIGMPDMTYGWSKLSGEYLAQFAAKQYGLDVAIYRPFSGYGEDQSLDYPFPSIIKRVFNREDPLMIWGSGLQVRDFIHIDDVVEAVLATMYELRPAEVINLGSGIGTRFEELALMACAIAGHTLIIENDLTKPEGVFGRVADIYKLSKYYHLKVSLDEGITRALKFMALDRQPESV